MPTSSPRDRVQPAGATAAVGPTTREARARPWLTIVGTATAPALEETCRGLGVRFDRARRTYWQRERLFPLSAARHGAHRRGRGRFHPDAAQLAVLVDACLRARLPFRPEGARSSLVPLRELIAEWWWVAMEAADDPAEAERRFYSQVAAAAKRLRAGEVPIELTAHRAPSPAPPVGAVSPRRRGRPRRTDGDPRELDALSLAVLLEFASNPDHPAKRGAWRISPDAVRDLLAAWPAPSGDADDTDRERTLGRWVARLAAAMSAGQDPLPVTPVASPIGRRRDRSRPAASAA